MATARVTPQRAVVEATGFGVRAGLLEGERLVEVQDVDDRAAQVTDALFLGRVTAVDGRLNAAFVDIGEGEPALLVAKDARFAAGAEGRPPISKLVQEGERLVVQGVREAEGGKGPRVTTDLKLFGFHLIHRPLGRGPEAYGPARGAERQALQERGEGLFPGGGVTLRRLAAEVPDGTLVSEVQRLEARWARLRAGIDGRAKPGRIAGDEHPLERLLRGVVGPDLEAIEVADEALAARASKLLEGPLGPHAPGIELVRLDPARSAFEQTGVEGALEAALARVVPLPRGGSLTIEPTAAFVAVDVDGEGRGALDVDLEAAAALARLVRLRNLGGTIVVDFIDLATKPERQRLEDAVKRAFRDDPMPVDVYPMSPLGIVQISRARRGRSLDALLRRPCGACEGSGRVASLRARAEALIHAVSSLPAPPRNVRVAPDLLNYVETGPGAAAWRANCPGTRPEAHAGLAPGNFETGA